MKHDYDDAVKYLKALSPEQLGQRFLQKTRSGFICPNPTCRDGSGRDGTGMTVYPDDGDGYHYFCGKCNRRYDNIDVLGFYYGLNPKTDFVEILKRAADDFVLPNFNPDDDRRQSASAESKRKDELKAKQIKDDILRANANLADYVNSFESKTYRGLTFDTLQNFRCGYLPDWYARPGAPLSSRFIVPTSFAHYLARFTGDKEQLSGNLKEKEHRGSKEIFNFKRALQQSDDPVCILVEGEFDAMSIWQVFGGKINVAAIGGSALSVSMERKLKFLLPKVKNFIVLLDNDATGRKKAPEVVNKILRAGHKAIAKFLDGSDDPNALLQKNPQSLKEQINDILAEAEQEFALNDDKIFDEDFKTPDPLTFERQSTNEQIIARINELRQQPQSAERDALIRSLIRNACEWKTDRKKNRTEIKGTTANMILIFQNDPDIDGLLAFDEFQNTVVLKKPAPWSFNFTPDIEWKNTDNSELRHYLNENYAECVNEKKVTDTLIHYANKNHFHPIREFISSLPKWDGVPRAESIFIRYLGAKDTPYTRKVTMNWFFGLYARLFHPGCDYQQCLVLQGAQGIGKSNVLRAIAGDFGVNDKKKNWYASIQDQLGSPQVVDQIQKVWLAELEEGIATSKADVRAIKAFLSTSSDLRRFPYDPQARYAPRHCVFVITTNEKAFLRDTTGNRRFMIIVCHNAENTHPVEFDADYIRQVHAEVYEKYLANIEEDFDDSKLQLPYEILAESANINRHFTQDDGLETELISWIDRKLPPALIWNLLTRKERADFCANGFIAIPGGKQALIERRRHGSQKNRDADISAIRDLLYDTNVAEEREFIFGNASVPSIVIYGTEPRKHVCIAELVNECFANKRIAPTRISELLFNLEKHGWSRATKIFNGDKVYTNQRNYLVRDDISTDDKNNPDNNQQQPPPTENPPQPTKQSDNTQQQSSNPPAADYFQGEPLTDHEREYCPVDDPPPKKKETNETNEPNDPDDLPF